MDDEIPKHRAKKNKKKWCKGKVGIQHDMMWVMDEPSRNYFANRNLQPIGTTLNDFAYCIIYKCLKCHKEFDRWWPGVKFLQEGYIEPVIGQREPKQKREN